MLVLSRRPQQSLLIGHDVVVTVLEVNGDTVRIGIKAPADVDIHREEIYRDLQKANQAASGKPGAAAALAKRMKTKRKDPGPGGADTPAGQPSGESTATDDPAPR